jgi:hypothetical protein
VQAQTNGDEKDEFTFFATISTVGIKLPLKISPTIGQITLKADGIKV